MLCLKQKIPPYTVPSKTSSPFLAFACVGEVDGDADFAAGGGEGGGASAVSIARRGPPEREGARGRMIGNNNLTVLNNFSGRNLLEIK